MKFIIGLSLTGLSSSVTIAIAHASRTPHHSMHFIHMVSSRGDGAISAIICSVIVVSLFIAYFTMDVVSVPYYHRRVTPTRGVLYDLEHESYHFHIRGFEYYAKCPLTWRPSLRATGVWFLRPATRVGKISIGQLQRKSSGMADVIVVVKYHLGWNTRSKLVVSGLSHKTHEMVSTELTQIGEGYCTRVIYLGCVHEIFLEGHVASNAAFVLIDDLKVGVGTSRFDGISEESCD